MLLCVRFDQGQPCRSCDAQQELAQREIGAQLLKRPQLDPL